MNIFRFTDNKTIKIFLSLIPVIALCILIFCLSAQPGSESDNTSSTAVSFLPSAIIAFLAEKFDTDLVTMNEIIEAYLRKTAHFCEFGLLSVLCSLHFSTWCKKRYLLYSFVFTVFYAASDEFHQLFVEGRSSEIRDVIIDSCGSLTALLLLYILIYLYKKHKKVADCS